MSPSQENCYPVISFSSISENVRCHFKLIGICRNEISFVKKFFAYICINHSNRNLEIMCLFIIIAVQEVYTRGSCVCNNEYCRPRHVGITLRKHIRPITSSTTIDLVVGLASYSNINFRNFESNF